MEGWKKQLEERKVEINLVKREIERVFHEKNQLALSENPPLEKIKTLERVWENAIKRHSQLVRAKEGIMEIIAELEKEEEE